MVEIGGDLISHCESRGGDVTKVGKSVEPNEEGRGDGAQAGRCRIARHWCTVVFGAGSSRVGKRCGEFPGIKVTESYCNPFQSHSKKCSHIIKMIFKTRIEHHAFYHLHLINFLRNKCVAIRDDIAGVVVRCGHSPVIEAFVGEFATVQEAEHEFSDFVEGSRGSEHDPTVHRQRGTYTFTRHCDSWEGGLDSEGAAHGRKADILGIRGDGSAIRILRESALGFGQCMARLR